MRKLTQNSSLEFDIREKVSEAEILVGEFPRKYLEQISHIPGGAIHIVVDFPYRKRSGNSSKYCTLFDSLEVS